MSGLAKPGAGLSVQVSGSDLLSASLGFATVTGPEAATDAPTGNSLVEPEDIPALGEGHKDRSCVPIGV